MKYKAVIFDLFGTLVDNFEGSAFAGEYQQIADILGLDGPEFEKAWTSEPFSTLRSVGHYATFEDCLRDVCRVIGGTYDPAVIPQVIALRMQVARANMAPRPDTIGTLRRLREMGLKIGLVSDCSWDVPVVWPETPMAGLVDAAIFSCTAKMKKPDPRIYEMICGQLSVHAGECLYVGDGGSDELAGARRAGMDAALICVPYEQTVILRRAPVKVWDGPRVSSVAGVVGLVNGGAES
jgi:putative hydrolase of the HAD superfamily